MGTHHYQWTPSFFPSRLPLLCRVLNVVGDPQLLLLFLWLTLLLPHSPCRAILEVVSWSWVSFYWIECDVCGASYFLWELKTQLSLCEPIRHDCNSSQHSDCTNFHNCYHVVAQNALFLWIQVHVPNCDPWICPSLGITTEYSLWGDDFLHIVAVWSVVFC